MKLISILKILGTSANYPTMLDVLIVASRAEHVNSRVEAAIGAGLDVVVVDVESYAVERAVQHLRGQFSSEGKDKIVAIIDIGEQFSHLYVFHGMKLIFSREEKFGSKQLLDEIAQHYKITTNQVFAAKSANSLSTDFSSGFIEPFQETLLFQIKRTLQFFNSSAQHEVVDHIFLAGGFIRHQAMDALIQEELGVKTTIVNPLSGMALNQRINADTIINEVPALMVACGLALRKVG